MTLPRRSYWAFGALGLVVVILIAWAILHKKPAGPPKVHPVPVSVAVATVRDVPVSLTALSAAQAWKSALVRTQVNGKLLSASFVEGTDVQAGQLLAQIDPGTYQAALLQARGALERDKALLRDARLDLERYRTLKNQDSIALQQVSTQAALVQQDEGLVHIDEGAVAAAQINLRWCRILSPISGRTGVRLVDPGNLVSTSDTTGIVIVNQIEPIAVTFTVPQGDFQRLSDISDGFRKPLTTVALSQETNASLGSGELSIADNKVDPTTGTVQLKARFANAGRRLWPGQFVNVLLTLQTLEQKVTIPSGAVNHGPNGAFAYVVVGGKAMARTIRVGSNQGGNAVIETGIKAGETVVIDGQMTLTPGLPVSIHRPAAAGRPAV
ncbi:Probable Co/Zn/Cd efflux system membrane fusion protein [hydrothermal vent metagenome]|uniref:Probable Co/Zn/Cd efflux system membrane fusion protein n=1 Tax=hydrothermal vent metagenome TaxID=652676 RepID=A0A160TNR0_9ZZZZ